jgi:hypothetical protein
MEPQPAEYDEMLTRLAGEMPGPIAFDDLVRTSAGRAVPPGIAWDWWRRAQESGTLVFAGVRPHGDVPLVGPRLYRLAD